MTQIKYLKIVWQLLELSNKVICKIQPLKTFQIFDILWMSLNFIVWKVQNSKVFTKFWKVCRNLCQLIAWEIEFCKIIAFELKKGLWTTEFLNIAIDQQEALEFFELEFFIDLGSS